MSVQRSRQEKLVEEFNVQVYSSGRVDWDRLDRFLPGRSLDRGVLMSHLKKRLAHGDQDPLFAG